MNRIPHLCLALGVVGLLTLVVALAAGAQAPARAGHSPTIVATNTYHVPDDFSTIQAAINAATDGDTILVAAGTYKENLSITEGITLAGGWNISFTSRSPGSSAIDGQRLGRAISITCASSSTVVTVDGFTVMNGDATGQGGPLALGAESLNGPHHGTETQPASSAPDTLSPAEHAARLRARWAELADRGLYPGGPAAYRAALIKLDRLTVQAEQARSLARPIATGEESKQAGDCGGGIYSWNASLRLLNCGVQSNVASTSGPGLGGGIFVGQAPPSGTLIAGNVVQYNTASLYDVGAGGGLHVLQAPGAVIENNQFLENLATNTGLYGVGGGLRVDASPNVVVRGNQVKRNTAQAGWYCPGIGGGGNGGGVQLRDCDGAVVTGNVIRDNLASLHCGSHGGGLYVFRAQGVTVADNDVSDNWGVLFKTSTDDFGGGLGIDTVSRATVTNNVVQGNVAAASTPAGGLHVAYGGGFYGLLLWDSLIATNTITGNLASAELVGFGGGLYLESAQRVTVAGNTVSGNVASLSPTSKGVGGGLDLRNTVDILVQHNLVQNNRGGTDGTGFGGGLSVESFGPYSFDTTVDANLFLNNRACGANPSEPSAGGACRVNTNGFTFTNNVVAGNTADLGGGLDLERAVGGVVVNNTLVGNGDVGVLVDRYSLTPITFTNNVIVSHTVGISVSAEATVTVRYTLWHGNGMDIAGGGVVTHTNPVTGAPAFLNPAADDYHLTVASAARDAGDPAGVPPAPPVDRDGVPRPQGPRVDLGAYEWRGYWLYLPLAFKCWPTVGWAVGDSIGGYGTILHTTDGGASWVRQGSPADVPDTQLKEVSAVDAQNAWVAGANAVLRTRDGGQTWETQTLPANLPAGFELMGVKAIDRNTAWVVGTPDVLLGTTDGQTWTVMPRGADLHLASPVHYSGVDAADATHVWAVGSSGPGDRGDPVIAFYDGTQWRRQGAGAILSGNGAALIGISALNQNTVWAVGGMSFAPFPLVKTTDGGATWQQVGRPPIPGMDTNRAVVVTADIGWVSGDDGNVEYTTDAGATWSHVSVPSAFLFGITAIDDQTAWVVGPGVHGTAPGIIAHTSDAQHWEVQSDPSWPNMNGISFVGARR
jgi:photosystem II stability/assembly factor-like uncharacterized protein/nitrous oxidase accessory protein NosD